MSCLFWGFSVLRDHQQKSHRGAFGCGDCGQWFNDPAAGATPAATPAAGGTPAATPGAATAPAQGVSPPGYSRAVGHKIPATYLVNPTFDRDFGYEEPTPCWANGARAAGVTCACGRANARGMVVTTIPEHPADWPHWRPHEMVLKPELLRRTIILVTRGLRCWHRQFSSVSWTSQPHSLGAACAQWYNGAVLCIIHNLLNDLDGSEILLSMIAFPCWFFIVLLSGMDAPGANRQQAWHCHCAAGLGVPLHRWI